jgi:FkbM family methyltransferase
MNRMLYGLTNSQPFKKAIGGVRRYGLFNTMRGLIDTLVLKARRPAFWRVITQKDWLDISFSYPQQLMPSLVLYREISVSEIEFLRTVLRAGSVYFDVGSGIGCYAVFAAKVCGAEVHAFEPVPDNVATMRRNLEANGVANRVHLNACAVSDQDTMRVVEKVGTNDFSYRLAQADSHESTGHIRTVRLDHYCNEHSLQHIDVLNLDVEGHDREVLRGARQMIDSGNVAVIMIEVHYSFEDVYSGVVSQGYVACYYDHRNGKLRALDRLDAATLKARRPSAFNRRVIFVRLDHADIMQYVERDGR